MAPIRNEVGGISGNGMLMVSINIKILLYELFQMNVMHCFHDIKVHCKAQFQC